jgi:peptide/nickel transport system substrate-binding protein
VFALLPATVTASEVPRSNAYTQPHILRYAEAEDITGLNQVLSQQAVVTDLSQLTMAWLFRWDKENRPLPELATVVPSKQNGGISGDGKTITYRLRKNVRWSDGKPFDASDLKFSFDVMNNKANNVTTREGFELITKIDEPDKYTVVLHLREPYSLFIPNFFTSAGGNRVFCRSIFERTRKHQYGALQSVAGWHRPFKYTSWKRGDSVEMEANPLYWRGAPKLHKIIFKIVPDRNTVLTQLQTGELDLWVPFGGAFLSRVQAMQNVVLGRHAIYTYNHLDFNTTRPAVRDREVRRALRYAIDRVTLREKSRTASAFSKKAYFPRRTPACRSYRLLRSISTKQTRCSIRPAGNAVPMACAKNGVRLSLEFASSSGSPDVDTDRAYTRIVAADRRRA